MSLIKKAKYCVYDSWDITPPKISPRSRLYHLNPIGIGTSRTESCTGYIARLAEEHCVSTYSLFGRELVAASNRPHLLRAESQYLRGGTFVKTMTTLNGRSRRARDWIEVLESLTLQRNLHFLTMLTWQEVLTHKSLLRSVRTWCSQCLEEQRETDRRIYEHLLWALGTVGICPAHRTKLATVCPHCHHQTPPFTYRLRPGHCSRCLNWLGHSNKGELSKSLLTEDNDFEYELWIANQMGQLVAQAPYQSSAPSRERIRQFITTCIKRTTGGNVTAFADMLGIDRFVIYTWRRKHLPATDLVLKICYRLGVSFYDLVTKGDVFPEIEMNEQFQLLTHKTATVSLRNRDVTRLGLLVALEDEPPPTLRQVADRLGYKLKRSLHTRYPELTKRLTARQRASRPKVRGRLRKKDPGAIKLALQQALENELPPTLSDIAGNLGYENLLPLRRAFSILCEAILVRRARYWEKQRNGIRIKLNAALLEYPPPSPSEVSTRVGYKSGAGLRRSYPKLFAAILKRHTKYRKTQFDDIRRQLKAVLREKSPPSLRATAKRVGKKYLYLHEHFPKECKAIIKRYAQFKKKSMLERKARAKTRMRRLALGLYAKDRLSYSQLKRASNGPTGLECSELCTLLREIKRELLPKRD